VAYSKTWSAKLVAHVIWTDAVPTREMFNQDASFADPLSKIERLAAVSSIRFV